MAKKAYDLIIVGGSIAGLSAAIYAGRFKLDALVITPITGGAALYAKDITNYPGIKKTSGIEIINTLKEQIEKYNIDILLDRVISLEKSGNIFVISTDEGKLFNAKAIIIATGTEWKKLNIPGEEKFSGKGVHYCTICDGLLYKDKTVAVIGGSDSAVKEAIYLSEYGKKVYLIYRKENIKAEPSNKEILHLNRKIEIIYNTNIKEIKGDKFVDSIVFDKEYNGSNELKIEGLFINIGNIPVTELAKKTGISLNEKGEIITDKESKTNIKGIFAAGDVTNKKFKQVISAASEGAMAAYSSYTYLQE